MKKTSNDTGIPDPVPLDKVLSLKGRCAIVTGGSRGIGEAIVKRFVEAGAAVVFTGRGLKALQRVEKQIKKAKGEAITVQADVSSLEDSQKVVNLTVEKFGHIDILVNNAAVFPPGVPMEITESVWDEIFDTDLKGAFFLSKFAAEAMIAAGNGGRIINLLSTAAFRIQSIFAAYGAAKVGLWHITKVLAQELAEYQILVNAVTPGSTMTAERLAGISSGTFFGNVPESLKQASTFLQNIDLAKMITKMAPLGRPGYPDDLADATLFLASDMAKYISGVNIIVDGGQSLTSMRMPDDEDDEETYDVQSEESTGVLDKSLEGTFKVMMKTPLGDQEVIFVHHIQDDALTGTVTVMGNTTGFEKGNATEDGFAYQFKMKGPLPMKVKVKVTGKVDGDKISGTLKTRMGSIPFEGKRVQ